MAMSGRWTRNETRPLRSVVRLGFIDMMTMVGDPAWHPFEFLQLSVANGVDAVRGGPLDCA